MAGHALHVTSIILGPLLSFLVILCRIVGDEGRLPYSPMVPNTSLTHVPSTCT